MLGRLLAVSVILLCSIFASSSRSTCSCMTRLESLCGPRRECKYINFDDSALPARNLLYGF